ncbi:MAG: sterol desaturase family protein [Pseudomonadota bacterium]
MTPAFVAIDYESTLQFLASRPNQALSFGALFIAFVIAICYFSYIYKKRRGRPASVRKLLSFVFPRRLIGHKSNLIDFMMFFINHKLIGLALVWMVVSFHYIHQSVNGAMAAALGPSSPTTLDPWLVTAIMTVALYIAYEFAYWLDHWLCHRIPFLWEFHRVHHEAEVLTPMTNIRVHPVDSLFFSNVMAVVIGSASGMLTYGFGYEASDMTIYGINAILMVGILLVVQLQHSHVWIPFTGVWGHIFMSPAHHQIHHSLNPKHYDTNMGSCLCVFDWMFGTLYVPSKEREKITFGVEQEHADVDPHTIMHSLVDPFVRAFRHLRPAPKTAAASAADKPASDLNTPIVPAE